MPFTNHPENENLHVAPALSEFTECHHEFVGRMHTALYLPDLLDSVARARTVAADLMRTFGTGLLAHHEDEERELFPAVQRAARPGEERERVDAMVARLVDEHHAMEGRWKRIAPLVAEAAAGGLPKIEGVLVEDIVQHFFEHVHFEEHEFLPLAQDILSRQKTDMKALDLALHKRHAPAAGG